MLSAGCAGQTEAGILSVYEKGWGSSSTAAVYMLTREHGTSIAKQKFKLMGIILKFPGATLTGCRGWHGDKQTRRRSGLRRVGA